MGRTRRLETGTSGGLCRAEVAHYNYNCNHNQTIIILNPSHPFKQGSQMYSIVSGCNYSWWNNNAWFKIKNLMSSIHLPVDPSHVFLWRRLFESCLILTFCKFLLYLISNKRIKSIKRKIWVAVISIERRKRERTWQTAINQRLLLLPAVFTGVYDVQRKLKYNWAQSK